MSKYLFRVGISCTFQFKIHATMLDVRWLSTIACYANTSDRRAQESYELGLTRFTTSKNKKSLGQSKAFKFVGAKL